MTLSSHTAAAIAVTKAVTKAATKNKLTMNALVSMVFVLLFLTSTLVHANHLVDQSTHTGQQECHICHQGLGTPPELPQIQVYVVISSRVELQKTALAAFKSNNFVQPQLRAPPSFQ